MGKRTKKVGIMGKYGTRYGAALKKMAKKLNESTSATYVCPFCGKDAIRRVAVSVWKCRRCNKILAGGAWQLATPSALSVKTTIHRLRKEEKAAKEAEAAKAQKKQ
jgi:large subunit ribosomal protein L37Ae